MERESAGVQRKQITGERTNEWQTTTLQDWSILTLGPPSIFDCAAHRSLASELYFVAARMLETTRCFWIFLSTVLFLCFCGLLQASPANMLIESEDQVRSFSVAGPSGFCHGHKTKKAPISASSLEERELFSFF